MTASQTTVGFFDRLREAAGEEWTRYTRHEFVRRLGDGSLEQAAFRHYLIQDYLFLIHFARAYALAVYKSDTLADMRQAGASLSAILDIVRGHEARAVQLPRSVVPEPDLFVGQQTTLAKLREEARAVTDGGLMRLVLLEGPAGTGKSTIVEEISHWLARRGWLVVGGHCYVRESIPYQGWHEIVRRIGAMCDALPPATRELIEADRLRASRLFPSLAPAGAPPADDAQVGRFGVIRALRRVLGVLAEQRPIVLCLEDLHWASWDTSSFLMDLFSETAAIPCLVLGTWRTDTERRTDHALLRDLELSLLDVNRIHVAGFSTDEAREFLVTKAAGASLEDLRTILRTGRSSPRFLEELLWELEQGRLEGVDNRRRDQILPELYRRRLAGIDKRHEAMLNLLAVAHNYRKQGKRVLLIKPRLDDRFALDRIVSRSGQSQGCPPDQ